VKLVFRPRIKTATVLAWNVPAVLERLEDGVALCDAHGRIVSANRAWRDAVDPAAGLRCLDALFAAFIKATREGRATASMPCADGIRAIRVSTLGDEHFLLKLDALPDSVVTVTEQPAAAPRLSEASPFGAAVIGHGDPLNAPLLEANAKLEEMAGGPIREGVCLGGLLVASSRTDAAARLAVDPGGPTEVTLAGAPERVAHLYLTKTGAGWAAYVLDVTDQKAMQLQLAQRNKMEAIGQLAGGVAHDFNNLLSAIRMRADELLLRHPLGDPSYDNLGEIKDTVIRAATLVRQLLTFSRKATTKRETIDLGDALMNLEILLRRLLREDVKLETDYGRSIPLVRADKALLENAVMNLVVNARDAVRGAGGGTIRLRCAGLTGDAAVALGFGGPPPPRLALIEISDDGPGIPAAIAANVFEPFFTTKGVGEGTGLGLSTVYGAVKQANGSIIHATPPGGGAVFRIFLPEAGPVLDLEPASVAPVRAAPRDLSGAGRILFVEDEPLVRGIAARLLRTRGYEVLEAADGEAALEICRAEDGRIDLMISDVIMPGIDGPTLLKAARPYLRDAPVMFISGYAEAEFSDVLEAEPGVTFLAKPLDIMTLAEQVKLRLQGR
jgi:two-component system cell cycle sensor histidine kinase/response regulator CckA